MTYQEKAELFVDSFMNWNGIPKKQEQCYAMEALFVGGKLNGKTMTTEEIMMNPEIWNGRFSRSYARERAQGCCVPRAELDNQPLVDGYLSPMWDGGRLRYETQEVYDLLSM